MKKHSFGDTIIEGLTELADALERNEDLDERFTSRRILLRLDSTIFKPALIRETRELLSASQAVFARFLGVSTRTVQAWESGQHMPNDIACRFMDEIRVDPAYWKKRIQSIAVRKTTRAETPVNPK